MGIDDVVSIVLELKDGRKVKYNVLRVYKMVREVIRYERTEHISLGFLTLPPVIEVPEKCRLKKIHIQNTKHWNEGGDNNAS